MVANVVTRMMTLADCAAPCSVTPGVKVLDFQDCSLSAVFLVAVASFIEDSQDDVCLLCTMR
jgi:hypothetical protein